MKISIITPNFNGEKYIENCIKSVLDQEVDFEHIIIDSNSTDSSANILKKYPHLKIVCEKDDGMYYAINKGIELSQGEIISYLNVDDRYPIGALKKVLSSFNDHRADYVYGDCRFINTLEKEIYVYKVPPFFNYLLKQITVIPWSQPSFFFRKSVLEKIQCYDVKYYLASDYHFMKQVVRLDFKGIRCKGVLSEFMIRKESLGSKYSNEMQSEVAQIKKDLKIDIFPAIDFIFNSYRKLYNFHTFFSK